MTVLSLSSQNCEIVESSSQHHSIFCQQTYKFYPSSASQISIFRLVLCTAFYAFLIFTISFLSVLPLSSPAWMCIQIPLVHDAVWFAEMSHVSVHWTRKIHRQPAPSTA
jgi:hypothetical protein